MSDCFDSCLEGMARRCTATGAALFLLAGLVFNSPAAQSVTLAWNANGETNLSGYRLHFGQASRTYSGTIQVSAPTTTATVPNLQSGLTYYFAVSAFTSNELESDYSEEVSYTVPYIVSPLTIVIHGDGMVTPNLHGQNLIVGHGYQLTAVPGAGQTFSSWGGDVSGTGEVLTFVMQSNMVIEATFEADPFLMAQGTYTGLLAETDEVRHERSGNFTLTATKRGTYTGKVQVGRTKGSIKGLLARDGKATNIVLRPGQSPLTVEVSLDVGGTSGRLTGRVTDGSWTAPLLGDRRCYNSKTNPAPFAGSYTLVVPSEGGQGPEGHGYGTVKVDRNGAATFIGMLADGTKAVHKVSLSQEGHWPFYLGLYKGSGSALGWLIVTNGDIGGLVSWIKPAMLCKYYMSGLTNEANVVGAAYIPPASSGQQGVQRAEVTCSGANLGDVVTGELMMLPNGKMMVHDGGALKLGYSPTTGLFKGTVTDPLSGKPRSFSGVLLQNSNSGAGLILGTNEVGRVEVILE
jgi:hypothetical protein